MRKGLALFTVLATICALTCRTGNAQIYKFQRYDLENGLCHRYVYSIAQDKHGFIWFATGMGLCRYDGFRFSPPNGDLPGANVTTAFKDNKDNLWFGYNDGLVVKYDGTDFAKADTSVSKKAVTQIIQAPGGEILVAAQSGGITRIDKTITRITEGLESVIINALCFAGDDRLLVGSYDGLSMFKYEPDGEKIEPVASDENLSYITVKYITPAAGDGYWVATEEEGIYYVTVNEDRLVSQRLDIPELDYAQVQSLYEDGQGSLWISTFGTGIVRVQLSDGMSVVKTDLYNSSNGMGSDYVKQVFFDSQQNLWVATYGNGVASITNFAISFFDSVNSAGKNVTAVLQNSDSEYWIGGMGAIAKITAQEGQETTVYGRENGLPNDQITVLKTDSAGNLWIGTKSSGLYRMAKDAKNVSPFYREENSLSNTIQNMVFADEKIWLATHNGVIIIDPKTAAKTAHYTTLDGLPHNNIQDIFMDSRNRIWLATNSNSLFDVRNGHRLTLPDGSGTEFSAIAEDNLGRLWAGTQGRGVFVFDTERDSIFQITSRDGLMSDYCYAITFDGKEHVWIGHRMGLTGVSTKQHTINTLGVEHGISGDVNPRAMNTDSNGKILIGTNDGIILYDTRADKTGEQVPLLNLSQVIINDVPYNVHKPVVLPYGRYRVQFDFVGLQYSSPASVSYQYLLQGMDDEWSSLSKSNTTYYHRLEDGSYSFWLKACNNTSCAEEKMLFSVRIRNPFWKTWWFLLTVIAAVIGMGYIIILVRERKHRLEQEYLESELKTRTKEVRRQKEEIEVKNRDITDSINYAQRIQFSVLPSTSTLLAHCTDAFIFYRPRDIVSGDFYWFDYFPKKDRLLIVCADSTGHGVPGAFMSLIGTTLIKDIAMRPDVIDPADILYCLDDNIQSILNQNRDSEQANDGMDIVVCEINTRTYLTKIASAMRPYIVCHNGTSTVHKCSRSSIGGQRLYNKVFVTNELNLDKGDILYFFTDGYTDQFGGQTGKKLKLTRLQNIIDDVYNRDMNEQYRVIKENFDLWKGPEDQVDDVLMIGVKI